VIVKEALANGRLASQADREHLGGLGKEAAAQRTTTDALAIAAALSQPWADVVLSGAVTKGQLASNLTAVALVREPDDWPDIAESPTDYWSRRGALAWQ
jgi:aryl-alcohol dehydrogenase-like predicted oxidoreductase